MSGVKPRRRRSFGDNRVRIDARAWNPLPRRASAASRSGARAQNLRCAPRTPLITATVGCAASDSVCRSRTGRATRSRIAYFVILQVVLGAAGEDDDLDLCNEFADSLTSMVSSPAKRLWRTSTTLCATTFLWRPECSLAPQYSLALRCIRTIDLGADCAFASHVALG